MEKIIEFLTDPKLYISILIIFLFFIIYFIIKRVITKILEKNKGDSNHKKRITYIKLIRNIIKYILLIFCVFIILQIYGINLTSVFVSLGVVGVIAGLALQDALKDIIMGFNILADNYFSVGDYVEINGVNGKVLEIGLKVTKIQELTTGNLLVLSNRTIDRAITVSNELYIDIPTQYEKTNKEIFLVIDKIIKHIGKIENVKTVECLGLCELGDSALMYKIKIIVNPEYRGQVKRESLKIIKELYDENNISIPYHQVDIHNKK